MNATTTRVWVWYGPFKRNPTIWLEFEMEEPRLGIGRSKRLPQSDANANHGCEGILQYDTADALHKLTLRPPQVFQICRHCAGSMFNDQSRAGSRDVSPGHLRLHLAAKSEDDSRRELSHVLKCRRLLLRCVATHDTALYLREVVMLRTMPASTKSCKEADLALIMMTYWIQLRQSARLFYSGYLSNGRFQVRGEV